LARAATAPAYLRKGIIKAATSGGGYDRYKGVRSNIGAILKLALNPFVPASSPTKRQIKLSVGRDCIASDDVRRNQSIAEGLYDYVAAHNVTAAEFNFGAVALGRAGKRYFWTPYILKIDDKKYIPFFDFRQDRRGLVSEARRFVFSINHSHIRGAEIPEYRDIGFVIFQFGELKKGVREAIPYFDSGISFWTDKEIGTMIDETYLVLDEIRRAA
jgi:hypothetical protein